MPSEYKNCVDCGYEFEFTERDQEFYQERSFTPPKRCRACRTKKKAHFDKGGFREENREERY